MDYRKAIELAMEGREEGFRFLYDSTYKSKYYLALKYMKNEDDAQDIMQDAYIRAFSKLDTLGNPDAFPKWLGMIVGNLAKNKLQKKNPMSFSEVAHDEDDQPFEYTIEDDNVERQPEISYTKQETQQMVRELVNSLSEEQRICILMYEIEGISIREIAAALQCSENTVKSRLNYGRKNLKKKAEELKNKGYALFSIMPIPLLLALLRREIAYMSADGILEAAQAEAARRIFSGENFAKNAVPKESTNTSGGTRDSSFTSDSVRGGKKATADGSVGSLAGGRTATVNSAAKRTSASGAGKHTAAGAVKAGFIHTAAGKAAAVVLAAAIAGGGIYYGAVVKGGQEDISKNQTVVSTESSGAEAAAGENVSSKPAEPAKGQISDDDYENLIEGNLTKEEFEFVLAYGPKEIPEGGFTDYDYNVNFPIWFLSNRFKEGSGIMASGEGIPVEYYGSTDDDLNIYSLKDFNDLMLLFTDYQYTSENFEGYGRVEGDKLCSAYPDLNYTSKVVIISAELTGDELIVEYLDGFRKYDDPEMVYTGKRAVLKPVEDGKFRIAEIRDAEVDIDIDNEKLPDPESSAQPDDAGQDVKLLYQEVLEKIKKDGPYETFQEDLEYTGNVGFCYYDMDGDGTDELLVSAECMMTQVFYGRICKVYSSVKDGSGYEIQPVNGRVIDLAFNIPGDGEGLLSLFYEKGTGNYVCYRNTIEDGELVKKCGTRTLL